VRALSRLPGLLLLTACAGGTPTVRRLNPDSLYSSPRHVNVIVTRGGRTVFVGGQGPWDGGGSLIGAGDFAAQLDAAFENLQTALRAAGARLQDVVQLRTYLVDAPGMDLETYRQARNRFFGSFPERPVATTVRVSGTTVPGALVLLEAVAVVDD
jgi:enamine deaminase RidA (YjgF/YER057c/UK114 family)